MVSNPVLQVIRQRCSVRSYTPDVLDAETVRTLLEAATRAPTAMHAEPWAFVVVQDIALLHQYSEMAKASWRGREFATALLRTDFNVFYGASTLIVICAKQAGPFAEADCWLAAENLMLAATAMGLGSCCIGSAVEALSTPDVRHALHIGQHLTVVAPIIVGRPAEPCVPVARKPAEVLAWITPEGEGGTS
jgi:nitroreductase